MDFSIPSDLQELTSSFRSFLDREVLPVEDRFRQEFERDEPTPEMREAAIALRHRSADLGFYAAHMPESMGNNGLSNLGYTLLIKKNGTSRLRMA